MPFYDKVAKIVYTDQLWNLEWQPFVHKLSGTSILYAEMNRNKEKARLSSPQQLTSFYNSFGIRVKPLSELIDNKYITQLIEVSDKAYILNGKYYEYKAKLSSQSFNRLGEQLGVSLAAFNRKRTDNKDKSDKEILYHLLQASESKAPVDILKKNGISKGAYFARLRLGWDKDKAMTVPIRIKKAVYDHKGNKFDTVREMVAHYGISPSQFSKRRKKGWTLEECLHPTKQKTTEIVRDHKGNRFETIREMVAHYGITESQFHHRKKIGMTLEECLQPKISRFHNEVTQDHKGKHFESQKEMCEYYGISTKLFSERRRKGWSLEKCLRSPKPIKKPSEKVQDHKGNQFKTVKDMLAYYGVASTSFYRRKRQGQSLEECLHPTSHIGSHSK